MSILDYEAINKRLELLKSVIDKLNQLSKVSKEDFIADFEISDAALHNLVLGIDVIVDIGHHILAQVFQEKADDYREIIEKLGKLKIEVVPQEFANENADIAKFRNLVIHTYLDLDLDKVYHYLQKAPDIFQKFANYFVEFLEKLPDTSEKK